MLKIMHTIVNRYRKFIYRKCDLLTEEGYLVAVNPLTYEVEFIDPETGEKVQI